MPAGAGPPEWVLKSWNCSFQLTNVTTTFGKEDSDCLIPFRSVSKHHAVIAWDTKKQHYKIKEAPFSLGTFVNDSRIGVRTIVVVLGDTIRFGADSPTFRVELKEKSKEFTSPRKTLSTVHDIEQHDEEEWPEQQQSQTVVSNNVPFVCTPITSTRSTPKLPAAKITDAEPPDLRDLDSPLMRASRDFRDSDSSFARTPRELSLSRSSLGGDDHRGNRASTPNNMPSNGRADNKRVMRNKGPKGSALYGQPTWWGEEEDYSSQSPRQPKHSHSTEFDPFDGYDRHEYASNDYPGRGPGDNGLKERSYQRERSYNNGSTTGRWSGHPDSGHHAGHPDSGHYDDDKYSERSYDRYTDRSYPRRRSPSPSEDRRSNPRSSQQRYEDHFTPPPSKPGMAFQITFDEPSKSAPRSGKKKRSSPPKDNEGGRRGVEREEDKESKASVNSDRSRTSNRSEHSGKHSSASERGSDAHSDTRVEDIELSVPDNRLEELALPEEDTTRPAKGEDDNNSQTSEPQEEVQVEDPAIKKELTQWANSLLRLKDYVPVFSIHDAVRDGRTLAQILHCIADEKVSDLAKDPKLRVEILPNIERCLTFSKSHNLITGDVAAREVVRGEELQITVLLEQLRASHKRKLERPAVPVDNSTPQKRVSESELTDDENVLPFRRNKTVAAPPRSKRTNVHNSAEEARTAGPLQNMLLQTLNELTQQLKTKVDKSAVYSLHIKEELDTLAGNNAPEDFVPNTFTSAPAPGSDNNSLQESEITQALKNLRFLERKLVEIEENLVYVRNETIPSLAKNQSEKSKKKKKGLSGLFKSKDPKDALKDSNLKNASSVTSINSNMSDSGMASAVAEVQRTTSIT